MYFYVNLYMDKSQWCKYPRKILNIGVHINFILMTVGYINSIIMCHTLLGTIIKIMLITMGL